MRDPRVVAHESRGTAKGAGRLFHGRRLDHDRVRQEAGIATMAVGAISEADHANSIIAAGRADLCAVARPHLANPAWTLTEAAKIGYTAIGWPKQYYAGKRQMESLFEREKAQK